MQAETSRCGDSGAPVFVPRNRRRTRLMIIGVHSYGYDANREGPRSCDEKRNVSGYGHIANALSITNTQVCTPRKCRR